MYKKGNLLLKGEQHLAVLERLFRARECEVERGEGVTLDPETQLLLGHQADQVLQRLGALVGVLLVPRGEPESAQFDVLEQQGTGRHGDWTSCHAAVGDKSAARCEQARHLGDCLATRAVEGELGLRQVLDQVAELSSAQVLVAAHNVAAVLLHALHELFVARSFFADNVDRLHALQLGKLQHALTDHGVGAVLSEGR